MFNLISSVTLVELTNINSDLMMKFAEVAPGTFQHSLQVSNLATEAAKKINANKMNRICFIMIVYYKKGEI